MQVQIKSWGNSQGIILSREVLKSSGISSGGILEITTDCVTGIIL